MRRITKAGAIKAACVAACIVALCAMLIGCGSGSSGSSGTGKAAGADLIGDWTAESVELDGESMDMSSFSDFGYYITLAINEDGTCIYAMTGEDDSKGTWTGKDASTGTVTIMDESFDASVEGGKLTLVDGNNKMVFAAGKPADASVTAAGTESANTQSSGSTQSASTSTDSASTTADSAARVAMDFTICDDSYATVTVTAKIYDDFWGAGYELKIVNKSDKDIYVTVPWDSASVNGTMDDLTLGETVKAGKNSTAEMYFMDEVASIDDLKDVEGTLQVNDDSTFETLSEYTFTIPD